MARWRLTEAHYLQVKDCFWEQVETDRETGRQRRKQYPVPLHLDPKNPADCNYRPNTGNVLMGGNSEEVGSIVVCWEGKGERRDLVFIGDPTSGMEPLDDEAKEVSERLMLSGKWNSVDTFDMRSASEIRADQMIEKMGQQNTPAEDVLAMQKQMMEMMGMMAKTLEQVAIIASHPPIVVDGQRRV